MHARSRVPSSGVTVVPIGNEAAASLDDCTLPTEHEPTELPGGVSPADVMLRAAHELMYRTALEQKQFVRVWMSAPCQQLFITFVWHAIALHFQAATAADEVSAAAETARKMADESVARPASAAEQAAARQALDDAMVKQEHLEELCDRLFSTLATAHARLFTSESITSAEVGVKDALLHA